MQSFSWKRNSGRISTVADVSFSNASESEDEDIHTSGPSSSHTTTTTLPKRLVTETSEDQVKRFIAIKSEAIALAENERYNEAVSRFNDCIRIDGKDSMVHEMKAQALIALGNNFAAARAAEEAVRIDRTCWFAHQTLGRAQLNFGDVQCAILSFQRALRLRPDDKELRESDLYWALSLQEQESARKEALAQQRIEQTLAEAPGATGDGCS